MNKTLCLVLLAAFCFATGNSIVKLLDLPKDVFVAFRFSVPFWILFFANLKQIKALIKQYDFLIFIASCLTLGRLFLFVQALKYAPFHQVMVISYAWPLMVSILSFFFLKEDSKKNILLSILGIIGIYFMFRNYELDFDNTNFLGLLYSFLQSVIVAIVVVFFKSKMKVISAEATQLFDCSVGALLLFPILIISLTKYNVIEVSSLFSYGLFTGFLGFFFFYKALKSSKASSTSVYLLSEVLFATLAGVLLFNETITLNTAIGAGLIVLSLLFVKR